MDQHQQQQQQNEEDVAAAEAAPEEPATVVIAGAGIVGLVLALALQKHVGVTAELYEQAPAFYPNVGAGMGMYPNGLRVIRDIDNDNSDNSNDNSNDSLLKKIRQQGQVYEFRRWERHDGSEPLMTADEDVLAEGDDDDNNDNIRSIGIQRWHLQKVLYDAAIQAGIPIHFNKTIVDVIESRKDGDSDDGMAALVFEDGSQRWTKILFGADGGKSTVRQVVTAVPNNNGTTTNTNQSSSPSLPSVSQLEYTGVTCLMGMANDDVQKEKRRTGISFPSSTTSKCHAVFFPTTENEQCFQFHFPLDEKDADPGNWGTLSEQVGKEECHKLAEQLRQEGWDEQYLSPLQQVTRAVRIGFCLLQPKLDKWVYGKNRRIVLVGDAAHPPVPYTGQGAQMGMEDAGTIALLLKHLCRLDGDDNNNNNNLNLSNFGTAMHIYEKMRIPRTTEILELSKYMGRRQQKRADNPKFDKVQEELLQREVFYHRTLSAMIPGATYDYKTATLKVLQEHHSAADASLSSSLLPLLPEEEEEEEAAIDNDNDDDGDAVK